MLALLRERYVRKSVELPVGFGTFIPMKPSIMAMTGLVIGLTAYALGQKVMSPASLACSVRTNASMEIDRSVDVNMPV